MFLSLVRPERISSPITSRAAVTASWGRDGSAMLILAWRREERGRSPTLPLQAMLVQVASGAANAAGTTPGVARTRSASLLRIRTGQAKAQRAEPGAARN